MTKNVARNLNPHKPAVMAMCLFSRHYAAQGGGSMDFWDSLSAGEQRTCRDLVTRLEQAPPEGPPLLAVASIGWLGVLVNEAEGR